MELSVNALSDILGCSYRKAAKMVRDIEPSRVDGRVRYYCLSTVIDEASTNSADEAAHQLARLRKVQADKCEVELRQLEARLIPAEDAGDAVERTWAASRRVLDRLPRVMAEHVCDAVGGDVDRVAALLAPAVAEAAGELLDWPTR